MRSVLVVTVGRSDYGIYVPLLRKLEDESQIELQLAVSGMHLAPEFGSTVTRIEQDGFPIAERVEMLLSSDAPSGAAASMGVGVIGFASAYARQRPDLLVVLGDRLEMHAAALAALPFGIPVAHIHGGELSLGAIDDALRHSITKLCHLHFVSTEEHARRVIQLGEEPWRVTVTGALGLDNLSSTPLLGTAELEARIGLPLEPAPLLVTFHPATLESGGSQRQIEGLLAALEDAGLPVIFTQPNADPGGRLLLERIRSFVDSHASARLVENLGTQAYFSMMARAAAMVGNSSSGIIEAASLRCPVVNVGSRQEGRLRPRNVIDAGYGRRELLEAIRTATAPAFRASLSDLVNPYGSGGAAKTMARVLEQTELGPKLVRKRFYDIPVPTPGRGESR